MAVTRAQRFRLGLFVVLGVGVFLAGLAILAGMKLGEDRDHYTVRFTEGNVSLSGLEVGSPVKYSGLRVGRVETVRVSKDDVAVIEVGLSLDGGTPVANDSHANLGSMGITGLKYIELTRGTKSAGLRDPGGVIPEGTSLIDDLSGQAGDIARKVQTTLDNVNRLTSPDMKDKVASILDRTDRTLAQLEAAVEENRGSLKTLTEKLATTADNVAALTDQLGGTIHRADTLLTDARPRLNRALDHGASLLGELRESRKKVDGVITSADTLLKTTDHAIGPEGLGKLLITADRLGDRTQLLLAQSRESIVESLAFTREAMENMAAFSEKIREDPSLLLLGEGADEGSAE